MRRVLPNEFLQGNGRATALALGRSFKNLDDFSGDKELVALPS